MDHVFMPFWCWLIPCDALKVLRLITVCKNWQTTLRTPEHILPFSSVSVSAALDDREVFERGRSWNVNTQKESAILQSPGLCHASIFHFSFCVCLCVCVFLRGRQKMEPYNCTVICSGPLFCPSLWSLPRHVTSLGNASVISTRTMMFFFFSSCRPCEIPLCVFSPSGWKSWIMIRTFVP